MGEVQLQPDGGSNRQQVGDDSGDVGISTANVKDASGGEVMPLPVAHVPPVRAARESFRHLSRETAMGTSFTSRAGGTARTRSPCAAAPWRAAGSVAG